MNSKGWGKVCVVRLDAAFLVESYSCQFCILKSSAGYTGSQHSSLLIETALKQASAWACVSNIEATNILTIEWIICKQPSCWKLVKNMNFSPAITEQYCWDPSNTKPNSTISTGMICKKFWITQLKSKFHSPKFLSLKCEEAVHSSSLSSIRYQTHIHQIISSHWWIEIEILDILTDFHHLLCMWTLTSSCWVNMARQCERDWHIWVDSSEICSNCCCNCTKVTARSKQTHFLAPSYAKDFT